MTDAEGKPPLPDPPDKWVCEECRTVTATPLSAPHPFIVGDEVFGCPQCLAAETLIRACQFPGCANPATAGYPSAYGFRYVWTCWEHSPSNPKNAPSLRDTETKAPTPFPPP